MSYEPTVDDIDARVGALQRRLESATDPRTRMRLEDEIQFLENGLQTHEDEQREMDYWAKQSQTVVFEITIDPDGAEVSCGANSGSWMVTRGEGEGPPMWDIQSSHAQARGESPTLHVDSLYGAIGFTVQRMLEAQQEGDGI